MMLLKDFSKSNDKSKQIQRGNLRLCLVSCADCLQLPINDQTGYL